MANPPKRLSKSQIDKDVKPSIYLDIKDKSEDIVRGKLQFYIDNCLSVRFTNSSYNYSHCRAAIDVICYFKDWDIPTEVLENDTHRKDNPMLYYSENSMKPNKVKRTRKGTKRGKSAAACRNRVSKPDPNDEFVVVATRPAHRPKSSVLFKKLMNGKK